MTSNGFHVLNEPRRGVGVADVIRVFIGELNPQKVLQVLFLCAQAALSEVKIALETASRDQRFIFARVNDHAES